jgi:lipopolysaccharide transport protein LptA
MTEVAMEYTKKEIFVVAVTVLCSVMANLSFADATADSVMLRRKPAVSASPRQVAQETAVQPLAVEASKPEVKPAESVKTADVSVEKAAAEKPKSEADEKKTEKKEKKAPPRDAVITADRTDYDRKEGVVLFDRNVCVDDEQYQMHTDRLFLFLDGTNDLKRLVAIGNVAITNENRRAYCARATFNKKLGRIVMYSSDEITASLREEGKKGSEVKGEKITFWIDSEQVEVENPVITMPGGFGGGGKDGLKKALGR